MTPVASTSSLKLPYTKSMHVSTSGLGSSQFGASSSSLSSPVRTPFATRTGSALSKTSTSKRTSPLSSKYSLSTRSSESEDEDDDVDSDDSAVALPQQAIRASSAGASGASTSATTLPPPHHHKSFSHSSNSSDDDVLSPSIQANYYLPAATTARASSALTVNGLSTSSASATARAASSASASSMGKNLARKRADSFKWSKYAGMGSVTIELGLSNDELRRV
ncbi:BQ5605_C004g02997 [Microbotryum silenes-dioicae]|uniref:BQ5605_C004g02997 protein n=1 Tax=Microbotryum silenes-dioicae TaxID=796604 RepID=A0A2X0MDJ4_9BASI|nr:BQ5605_C004g02997 [Microbotryum silenes-dioicae]